MNACASSFFSPDRTYAGGRGCAVRPLDDPLELEPDGLEDEPDDDDPDPEPDERDDEPPLDEVPLDDPDVYPTPLITFPCGGSAPRTITTGAP